MSDFVHLHNHTDYSLLDAAQSVDMMINRVGDIGMDTIAVTEHGNLFSLIPFYKQAKKLELNQSLDVRFTLPLANMTKKHIT